MRLNVLLCIIVNIIVPLRLYAMGDTGGNRPEFDPSRLEPWDVSICRNAAITEQGHRLAMKYIAIRKDLAGWIGRQSHAVRHGYIAQLGLPVRGLWASYEDTASPWSRYLAYYGRIFTYDTALALYTASIDDCYRHDFSRSRQAVDVILKMFAREEAKGHIGLLHFSYNTKEDSFIDPRAITGANIWMFKALYVYMLASGDMSSLEEVNRYVREYLLPLQELDIASPMYGFINAGYGHPKGMKQGGYGIYSDLNALNTPSRMAILEHNADFIDLLRIMEFVLAKKNSDTADSFRRELADRHALVMQASLRVREAPHWPTLITSEGTLNRSMAVDHYTWMASTFIGIDDSVVWESIGVLKDKFVTTVDSMEILAGPIAKRISFPRAATGLIFFEQSFTDPYVDISSRDRLKLERLIQPEATAGAVIFLYRFAQHTDDPDRAATALSFMEILLEGLAIIYYAYPSDGMPYATENTENYFNSTPSMAASATYYMALETLATGYPFFIGVPVPDSFADALTRRVDSNSIRRGPASLRR